MLRFTLRSAFLLIVLLAAGLLLREALEGMAWRAPRLHGEQVSVVYRLAPGTELSFPIKQRRGPVRVLVNAAVMDAHARSRAPIGFALDYSLGIAGKPLASGRYHFRSRMLFDRGEGRVAVSRLHYQSGSPLVPAATQEAYFDAVPDATLLRLRPAALPPGVAALDVRVYVREPLREAQADTVWQRSSGQEREHMAAATAYPPEFLAAREIGALVRNRWKPLGPQGNRYQARRLYSPAGSELPVVADELLPAGVYVDSRRRAVVPWPPGPTVARLELVAAAETAVPGSLAVSWWGSARHAPQTQRHALAGSVRVTPAGPGLLEVAVASPAILRVSTSDADLTPDLKTLRAYRLAGGSPLAYTIEHIAGTATPMRVDLRHLRLAGEPDWLEPAHARYRLKDAQGRVLGEGVLTTAPVESPYDRPTTDVREARSSEPERHYFNLPAAVATLELDGGERLWCTAYSRPPDLAHRATLPDDQWLWRDPEGVIPLWFPSAPRDAAVLERENRGAAIEWQTRPPSPDADVLAGRYDWRDYLPQGRWSGRALLVRREPGSALRDEARPAAFREIAANADHAIAFAPGPTRESTAASLQFLRGGSDPATARVLIDGQVLTQAALAGRAGRIRLPAFAPGAHRLRIESAASARWFVAGVTGDAAYLSTFTPDLRSGADLVFDVDKSGAGPEPLSFKLFRAPGAAVTLDMRLSGPASAEGPFHDWTPRHRVVRFEPVTAVQGWRVEEGGGDVAGGERIFWTLGSDLLPGRYRIQLRLTQGERAYVQAYGVSAGLAEQRRMIQWRGNPDE